MCQKRESWEGHTLDKIKRWEEIGPTVRQDQHLCEILRRRREEVFTGKISIRNAVHGDGSARHTHCDYGEACEATWRYIGQQAEKKKKKPRLLNAIAVGGRIRVGRTESTRCLQP